MKITGKHTLSSRLWLNRQANDLYVRQSKQDGYRARSAYKLIEINKKYKILNTAKNVVDLGAAPGGWSQVISEASKHPCSKISHIVGVDLLKFDPIFKVDQVIGNFTDAETQTHIIELLEKQSPDLVVSDMAPSTIGQKQTDHLRMMALLDEVLCFLVENLASHGNFVAKIFQGSDERRYINDLKCMFKKVNFFKPKSSRSESAEIYVVALDNKHSERSF